ncbi:MAG: hypothetical protein L3J11_03910 [Draconibacterium sp.]|nr:hypothetical protein [Draconibacterium sp.]
MDKAGDVILYDNKAKNVVIAKAIARIFNAVSVQKNKPEWSCYFVTMPKVICNRMGYKVYCKNIRTNFAMWIIVETSKVM